MAERLQADPSSLVRSVTSGFDEARVEKTLQLHLRNQRRKVVIRVAAGGALAIAASVIVAFAAWPTHEAAQGIAKRAVSPRSQERAIELADGSRFLPIGEAIVRVHEVGDARVRAELVSGAVDVEIVPRDGREVVVAAGRVTVRVLGTVFRVAREGDRTRVAVRRGRVEVRWNEEASVLESGGEGLYPPEPPSEAGAETDPPANETRVVPRGGWRALAEEGEYERAYDEIGRVGPGAVRDDVDELLLAADAARLSGHPREALPYLARAERLAGSDSRGASAAFTTGRILARLGRAAEAASAFERVLEGEPSGSLAESAIVRAVEAHESAGNRARAAILARRYVASFPDGRWVERMRSLAE
jgi:transmembrane sensor